MPRIKQSSQRQFKQQTPIKSFKVILWPIQTPHSRTVYNYRYNCYGQLSIFRMVFVKKY
jgi:hypothetical protein